MPREFRPVLSDAMATMVRTADGRSVRHAVRRVDEALQGQGMGPAYRAAYIDACRHVADTIAGRRAPATPTSARG